MCIRCVTACNSVYAQTEMALSAAADATDFICGCSHDALWGAAASGPLTQGQTVIMTAHNV